MSVTCHMMDMFMLGLFYFAYCTAVLALSTVDNMDHCVYINLQCEAGYVGGGWVGMTTHGSLASSGLLCLR